MPTSLLLMLVITFLYAGYNLFIKISSNHVPIQLSSTLLATIALQISALSVSCLIVAGLLIRGESIPALPITAYSWAILAGLCVGFAELGYFFLFRGFAGAPPMPANIAIPFIVSGTIVIAVIFAWLILREPMTLQKVVGMVLIAVGVAAIYMDFKPGAVTGS